MEALGEGLNVHEQSLQEMLRKARQQQQNRKAKQHNTSLPETVIFGCLRWDSNPRPSASGGTQTHDHQLSMHMLWPTLRKTSSRVVWDME